jgi:hypothetical protein
MYSVGVRYETLASTFGVNTGLVSSFLKSDILQNSD